jgi:PAS domain S-box-containing protein
MNLSALNAFYRRHGFSLAFILIGVIVVVVGALVVRDMRRSNLEVRHMYSDLVQDLDSTVELQYQTQEARRSMLYALTTTDSNRQVDYADQSRAADARVHELIDEAKKVASSVREAEATNKVDRDWAVYLKVRDEVIAEILEGSSEVAVQQDLREGVPAFDQVRDALRALNQVQKEGAQQSVALVETSSNRSLLKLIAILCLMQLLAGIAVKTVQKGQMLQVVQDKEQRFRSLIENSSDAIALFNEHGTILYASPSTPKVLGYTPEAITASNVLEIIHADDRKLVVARLNAALKKPRVGIEVLARARHKDGSWRWIEGTLTNLLDEPSIGAVVDNYRDVTERKQTEVERARLEGQLRQSQKMEAVGTLAGGIAHDFNNILGAIIGYSELALMDLAEDSTAARRVSEVLNAGNRAKDLVKQILTFSRQEEHERKPLRLQPIIGEALKLLRASLPSSIEIRQNIDAAASSILGDSTQIHQVLMNLCTNAWHAMDEHGGLLELALTTVQVDIDFANAHPDLKPGPHVRLVVSDTGKGMDRATVERIFEPFFTTKPPGSGTGLGLAVVHGIIKQFGGLISVYSEVGKGTTFNIYLPAHDRDAPPVLTSTLVPRGNGEHILFVDDEESLASLGKSMLERLGYRVTTEISSVKALKIFSAQPLDFDLVITDQTMPQLSGTEFAKMLLEIQPQLPVILSTGYSTAINPEKARAMGIREFLSKPNTAQALGEAIQRALSVGRKEQADGQHPIDR